MRPKEFEQVTHVLGKDQPEYIALPTHVNTEDPAVPMTCCFELTEEEAQKIAATREIWYRQLTFGNAFHPMHLQADNPFVENIEKLVPMEVVKEIDEYFELPFDVHTEIHTAIGAASMCWQKVEKAGVFDSERAAAAAKSLCEFIARKMRPI